MKQKDIAIIIATAFVSAVFSYVLANYLFGGAKAYKLTAPTIDPITAEFKIPDSAYFNRQSINLTKDITIGDGANSTPINTKNP